MESNASLCVSVVSGDHSVFGPDWIEVDTCKNLIDVLVQVAGTQVLGQQVQVIISKDSCFTESALFQLSASVGLLQKSGNYHVNFLLKENLLSTNHGLAGFKKESPTISKCIAERDVDITKKTWLSKESLHSSTLASLLGKDVSSQKYHSSLLSSSVDAAVDAALKSSNLSPMGLENFTNWYKERMSPPSDILDDKLSSIKKPSSPGSPKWSSHINNFSSWSKSMMELDNAEEYLKKSDISFHYKQSLDSSPTKGDNGIKGRKSPYQMKIPSPIDEKPSSQKGKGQLMEYARETNLESTDKVSRGDSARQTPKTSRKARDTSYEQSTGRNSSAQEGPVNMRTCTSVNSCGACIWCRHMKRTSPTKQSVQGNRRPPLSRYEKVETDQSDVESDTSGKNGLKSGSERSSSSCSNSKTPIRASKVTNDQAADRNSPLTLKGRNNSLTYRRRDSKKAPARRHLSDTTDKTTTTTRSKTPIDAKKSNQLDKKGTVNQHGNSSLSGNSTCGRSTLPFRKTPRSSSATPRPLRRDRPQSMFLSDKFAPSLSNLKKKNTSRSETQSIDSSADEASNCGLKSTKKKSRSLDNLYAIPDTSSSGKEGEKENSTDENTEETGHFSVDSIEKEPYSKKQTVVLQLSPTKPRAPTTLFISSCNSGRVDDNTAKSFERERTQTFSVQRSNGDQSECGIASSSSCSPDALDCGDSIAKKDNLRSRNESGRTFFKSLLEKNQMIGCSSPSSRYNTTSSEFMSSFFWVDCKENESEGTDSSLKAGTLATNSLAESPTTESRSHLKLVSSSDAPKEAPTKVKCTIDNKAVVPSEGGNTVSDLGSTMPYAINDQESSEAALADKQISNTAVIFLSQTSKATTANRTFTLDDGPDDEKDHIQTGDDLWVKGTQLDNNSASLTVSKVTATRGISSPTKEFRDVLADEATRSMQSPRVGTDGTKTTSNEPILSSSSPSEKNRASTTQVTDSESQQKSVNLGKHCDDQSPFTNTESEGTSASSKDTKEDEDLESLCQSSRKLWDKKCGLMDQLLLASLYAFSWELRGAAECVSSKTRNLFERWLSLQEPASSPHVGTDVVPSLINQPNNSLSQSFRGSQKDVAGVFRNLRKVEIRLKTMEKAIETMIKERSDDKTEAKKKKEEGFLARLPNLFRGRSFNWKDFKVEAKRSTWKSNNEVGNLEDSISESDDNET